MIFISHNSADKTLARTLASIFTAYGQDVWFDEWSIAAGESIVEAVSSGLEQCKTLLVLWSSNAAKSNWVRRELRSTLTEAIATGQPKVIPLVLDDTQLPMLLRDIKYLSLKGENRKERLIPVARQVMGEPPKDEHIREIVKLFHEAVASENPDDPFGLRACTQCGSKDLERRHAVDGQRDEAYYVIRCRECGWGDWTQ